MAKIVSIKWGYLQGTRPRHAGSNARMGEHGMNPREPAAIITTDDGISGVGSSFLNRDIAEEICGMDVVDLISLENGVIEKAFLLDIALWDLFAKQHKVPVYKLINPDITEPFSAPAYDTTLYFDDLHLDSNEEAAALLAAEAREGYERSHRAFKIKIGRGAFHMELEAGTQRDIAIIRAVRKAVGEECPIMIDANNGFNSNIARQVLSETADCNLYWLEEPFHEDALLYDHLHEWMAAQGLSVRIADGEGHASPRLMSWAEQGSIDVVQYDIRQHGFSRWINFGRQLDSWNRESAPHNYGSAIGGYVSCHLAAVIKNFAFVEWDHIDLEGMDASGYSITEGIVHVPDEPGFGLHIDPSALLDGFEVTA